MPGHGVPRTNPEPSERSSVPSGSRRVSFSRSNANAGDVVSTSTAPNACSPGVMISDAPPPPVAAQVRLTVSPAGSPPMSLWTWTNAENVPDAVGWHEIWTGIVINPSIGALVHDTPFASEHGDTMWN